MNPDLIVFAIMALLTGLLLRECFIVLRARAPAKTRALTLGAQAPAVDAAIPRVIWTYWPEPQLPTFTRACVDNWRQQAPDHEVRLLDPTTLGRWLPDLPAGLHALPIARRLEWIATQLLARHGGVWMSTSVLLSRDLAWLHGTREQRGAGFVGFAIDRDTRQPDRPAVASWLMAAVPQDRFASELAARVDAARAVPTPPLLATVAGELLAADGQASRVVLLRAEDSPLAWQAALNWHPRRLHRRLSLLPCPAVLPAVLQLEEAERAIVERNWRRHLVSPFSAVVQLVERPR